MSDRVEFSEMVVEAELHALGIEDRAARAPDFKPRPQDAQIERLKFRAERARAVATVMKKLEPHQAAFRQFLAGLTRSQPPPA